MSSAHSIRNLVALTICLTLTACGGGGSSDGPAPGGPGGPPATFAVGGNVSGLVGTVVLQNNGGDDLAVSTVGAFRFATALTGGGTAYRVTVKTQPATQTCTVTNDNGTVNAAAITNVQVTCVSPAPVLVTIHGTVEGLQGTGLVLQNNRRDDLAIAVSADHSFQFATQIATGERYDVTVLKQPVEPVQTCVVQSGSGTAGNATDVAIVVNCAESFSRFAYVPNIFKNTISIYSIDAATGQMRHRGYTLTGEDPRSVTIDNENKWVLSTNLADGSLSVYAINRTDGTLTRVGQAETGEFPTEVAIDPAGQFAYVTNNNVDSVSAFRIDSSGAIAPVDPANPTVPAGNAPTDLAIDPIGGNFLYVANSGSHTLSIYTIDRASGALTPQGTVATGTEPGSVTIDPSGKFVYVPNLVTLDISVFRVTNPVTGALEPVAGSPFDNGFRPFDIALEPTGRFAFVVGLNGVAAYRIRSDGGLASKVDDRDFQNDAVAAATDASGKFLYVTGQAAQRVEVFSIDGTTGELTPSSRVATQSGGVGIALSKGATPVTHESKFAYVAKANASSVSVFPVHPVRGLGPELGAALPLATAAPVAIAADPLGRFAYTTHTVVTGVSNFSIGASGALTQGVFNPLGNGAGPIAIDPTGRFAYVVNTLGATVSRRSINAQSGVLEGSGAAEVGDAPVAIAMDPAGRYAYVARPDAVVTMVLDPVNGISLNELDNDAVTPSDVVVDPSGRFVFTVSHDDNEVTAFRISPSAGTLVKIGAPTLIDSPVAIAFEPTGRFFYTANDGGLGDPNITRYTIDTVTGEVLDHHSFEIAPELGIPVVPMDIVVDATGKLLYVTEASGHIEVFPISPVTGDLSESLGRFETGDTQFSIALTNTVQ